MALDLLAQAQKLLEQGTSEDAVRLLKEALALDPDNKALEAAEIAAGKRLQASKLKEKAIEQMKAGEFAAAVGTWGDVFALEPLEDASGAERAGAKEERQKQAEAEAKAHGKALGEQAALQLEHARVDDAIASYDEALESVPASDSATDANRLHQALSAARAAALERQRGELDAQVNALLDEARELLAAGKVRKTPSWPRSWANFSPF